MPELDGIIVRSIAAALTATVVGVGAWQKHLLDPGGAIAAVITGTTLVAAGGWWAGILIVAFFATSSLLSISSTERPSRAWGQVLANGGPATLFAILSAILNSPELLVAASGSIAAATADTWATEIGRRSGAAPRSIRTLRRVPVGTSGAVSVPGSMASLLGAATIAVLSVLLAPLAPVDMIAGTPAVIVVTILVAGTAGSLIDTLLGATIQARFVCRTCGIRIEDPGTQGRDHALSLERGVPWITNDLVNALSSLLAGAIIWFAL